MAFMQSMSGILSQEEIRFRAAKFARERRRELNRESEARGFLAAFFQVLGLTRWRVISRARQIEMADGTPCTELFWKGKIIIRLLAGGADLSTAAATALEKVSQLPHHEVPHFLLVCDGKNWHYRDLASGTEADFTLTALPEHIHLFHDLAGYEQVTCQEEDPVNVKAAELLGTLNDRLAAAGCTGHALELTLVRILFCLFAEDTGILPRNSFRDYILSTTAEDGSDLPARLAELFLTLATPPAERAGGADESLRGFPCISRELFGEPASAGEGTAAVRAALLDCCEPDWGMISPAIFGSMFQCILKPEERRVLGAHYTSERNILKLINPLFLNDLRAEFDSIRHDKSNRKEARLRAFHTRLAALTFLDPACGCGNFLVIAYRELRRLELAVISEREQMEKGQSGTDWVLTANDVCLVNVNQFHGIEIEAFPAQIAQVAMWLMDHQMNLEAGNYFGEPYARIPLTATAAIVHANALRTDWDELIPRGELHYILGNPPFSGARYMSKEQKMDLMQVFTGVPGAGDLDFVAAWFKKSADYMRGTGIRTALVATNSLSQGQTVGLLWQHLLKELGATITFACRTFKWSNEARNNAAVHCTITGFTLTEPPAEKLLTDESGDTRRVPHINGYLVGAPDIFITNRRKPLCPAPEMGTGNKPIDDGNYLFTAEEKAAFLAEEPQAERFFRPWLGSRELIHGVPRFCLWLGDCTEAELAELPQCRRRIEAVKEFRARSGSAPTRALAARPARFHVENMPAGSSIAIPKVSSENRRYIPMAFLEPPTLCSDLLQLIPGATLYHFGVLTSAMHMAWTRAICGRLKSDYRYSNKLVYNNFPWPQATEADRERISGLAQDVLRARALYPDRSLAELYAPHSMPKELLAAHRKLDAAVDDAYGQAFTTEAERTACLFKLYDRLTADYTPTLDLSTTSQA